MREADGHKLKGLLCLFLVSTLVAGGVLRGATQQKRHAGPFGPGDAARRTAQAAMRHSSLYLTMNV